MRLAKLCITLALALCGWHGALASALCAGRADCHESASTRAARQGGHGTQSHTTAHAPADYVRTTTNANAAPANLHGHCDSPAESPREARHAAPHDAETEKARGDDEKVSSESVAGLRAPDPSCEHCVGRQTDQPARANSAAPVFARDSDVAPTPTRPLVALTPLGPRPRFAPAVHSPPRGRPLHLLNSALLI